MKKVIILLGGLLCVGHLALCQSHDDMRKYVEQQNALFAKYKEQARSEYSVFLEKRNTEYAAFLSQEWKQYMMKDGETAPQRQPYKKPVTVPEKQPKIAPVKIPIKSIIDIPEIKPVAPQFKPSIQSDPQETVKPAIPTIENKSHFKFSFAGSTLSVGLTSNHKFSLNDIKEKSVSRAWVDLSKGNMSEVINQCLYWKDELRLNDYLYVLMLDNMCSSFFGSAKHNEARLLKTYLLTQSGYDAKCARTSTGLVMLLSIEEQIYQKTYLMIDGTKYYIVDEPSNSDKKYYTFSQKFSEESKSCSVRIEEEFIVSNNMTATKKLASKRYPSMVVDTSVDKNLIELYDSYPRCKWDVYAKAPMSSQLSSTILPILKAEIEGKSEIQAANMILNFVQTAFKYKTDSEYFGYERSLFVDETFYYPYCDCEDRSILYANLMQKLLGLDVVLLYYPNHLATAIRFNTDNQGDYIVVKNQKYTICDPTYIGANVGVAMPQYKNVEAEVLVL